MDILTVYPQVPLSRYCCLWEGKAWLLRVYWTWNPDHHFPWGGGGELTCCSFFVCILQITYIITPHVSAYLQPTGWSGSYAWVSALFSESRPHPTPGPLYLLLINSLLLVTPVLFSQPPHPLLHPTPGRLNSQLPVPSTPSSFLLEPPLLPQPILFWMQAFNPMDTSQNRSRSHLQPEPENVL